MRTPAARTTRRRWPIILLAAVAAISTSGLVALLAAGGPGVGHFRGLDARAAYDGAYAEALDTMPAPTGQHDVETSFGTVRVYAWVSTEHPDATPVVLLPGRSASTPMWGENLPHYIEHRTVYSIDVLGDTAMFRSGTDCSDIPVSPSTSML